MERERGKAKQTRTAEVREEEDTCRKEIGKRERYTIAVNTCIKTYLLSS